MNTSLLSAAPFVGDGASEAAEREWIERACTGDVRAFEQLYRRHAPSVFGLCLRLCGRRALAEECLQDTFVRAWRALEGFEQRSRLSTWLHRIAVRTALAQRVVEAPVEHAPIPVAAANDDAPVDVERALQQLPAGARHVVVLVGLYGFTHEECATMLGIAVGTSKAQLHRGRALLAGALQLDEERR